MTDQKDDESLHHVLQRLIAERAGIRPEEVTTQWIHEQREKYMYPHERYRDYKPHLKQLTRTEIQNIHFITESLLNRHWRLHGKR